MSTEVATRGRALARALTHAAWLMVALVPEVEAKRILSRTLFFLLQAAEEDDVVGPSLLLAAAAAVGWAIHMCFRNAPAGMSQRPGSIPSLRSSRDLMATLAQ